MLDKKQKLSSRAQIKALRFAHHASIAFTIATIAASPYVFEYVIGYTSRQGLIRKNEYNRRKYKHLVILADRLNRSDALFLEGTLQYFILSCKRYPEYKKYDPDRRGKRHYPSAGQATADPDAYIHSVYMAWREGED